MLNAKNCKKNRSIINNYCEMHCFLVRESIRIGWTTLSEDQVQEVLGVLDGRYGGSTYDVERK